MKEHVMVLGALYIAFNVIGVMTGLIVLIVIGGAGILSQELEAIAITSTVAVFISFLIFIFSVPGLIGGIGLLKRAPWARILVLILGCMNLISIPFGTILGAYTIYVLVNEETVRMFDTRSNPPSSPAMQKQ